MMRRYTVRTFFGECAMLILCAVFLVPIYFLVVSSFKTQPEMLESPFGIPKSLDFSNYGIALEGIPTLLDLCLYNVYLGCVDCCVRVNGGVYDRKKDKSADKDLAKLFLDWFHGPASNDDVAAIPYHEISQPFEH